MTLNSSSQQGDSVPISLCIFLLFLFFPQLWFVPFFRFTIANSQMLAALTKLHLFIFHLSKHIWEGERAGEMLSVCIYVSERICVFVTATVMHACPQAGHKSSLEMAGMCVFVCLRVSACLPVCSAETIGFNAQQAGVIQLHCSLSSPFPRFQNMEGCSKNTHKVHKSSV